MSDEEKISHKELCEIGAKILKTKLKCTVSIHEPRGLKENPDAIGWRYGWGMCEYEGSILIEAKTSRADFKKDFKKSFRIKPEDGIGNWRFYICPTDIIKPEELPEKWGLIYVDDKRRTKIIVNPYDTRANRKKNKFNDFNVENERFLLTRWLSKTENPEKMSLLIRELNTKINRLSNVVDDLNKEKSQLSKYKRMFTRYTKNFETEEIDHDEIYDEVRRLRDMEFYMKEYKETGEERYLKLALNQIKENI